MGVAAPERPLAGAKLGVEIQDLSEVISNITKQIVDAALPTLKEAVAASAEAAEPTIRRVVNEDVMPKVTLGIVVGMIGVAGVSALIGSLFASSGRSRGAKLAGLGSVVDNTVEMAAGSGSSSMVKGFGGASMTGKTVASPPIRAKAAHGNLVHELRQSARELADELARKRSTDGGLAGPGYRPGYRPGYTPMNPASALGAMRLVNGEVKPGMVVLGATFAVPVQQALSKVLLQQTLGANEMVGDGVTGLAGILLHLVARTSFTLGFGTSLVLPFVADLTNWALVQVGLVKTFTAPLSGTRPQQRIGNTVTPRGATSPSAFHQQLRRRVG
jgi:hypothetical protein